MWNPNRAFISIQQLYEHPETFRNRAIQSAVARVMRWSSPAGVATALAVLVYGTVLVFGAFDRVSHSNSDTIRPFVITMAPVWAVAIAAARVLLKRHRD